jgi:hypothetical protein
MADGTSKPIEAVKAGDAILSRDPKTGQTKGQQVFSTPVRGVRGSLLLRFSDGERIETTGEHPFYVPGKGFVLAGRLVVGTRVATWKGKPLKVVKVEVNWTTKRTVYNLGVTSFHTYFVGRGGIWVHNGPTEKTED